jgi:ATP-dependent Clp protease ATP-binding subunit ClpB
MKLVDLGYEPAFGARPLNRAIQKQVQDPLAEEILHGGYGNGSTVKCDVEGDEFKFQKA